MTAYFQCLTVGFPLIFVPRLVVMQVICMVLSWTSKIFRKEVLYRHTFSLMQVEYFRKTDPNMFSSSGLP